MRRGGLLNDAQLSGMLPTSVGGGENADGNWSLIAGFCEPGSVMLLGFLALIAPCGGSFGLPKEISGLTGAALAVVMDAAVATPPAAVAANISRLDIMLSTPLCWTGGARASSALNSMHIPHCGLTRTGIDLAAGVLLFRSWWANGSNGLVSG